MNINQTIKKPFSRATMLLLATILFSMTAQPAWAWFDGKGTKDDPWQIKTADDLKFMSNYVNEGSSDFKYKYFKVMNDITFEHTTAWNDASSQEDNFTPIGLSGYTYRHFNGHFDGNGKTISGIRIYRAGTTDNVDWRIGLFSIINEYADIKGIVLADTRITGYKNVGGIVGEFPYSTNTITDCVVESTVCIHGVQNGNSYHGGIVGRMFSGQVSGCRTAATLTSSGSNHSYYGTIVGHSAGSVRHCFASNDSQFFTISGATDVNVVGYGNPVNYTVSGITGYDSNCYLYGGKLYAGANETLKLAINYTGDIPAGTAVRYKDGNGTVLTNNNDGSFSLTMPASNVTIHPTWLIALTITADSGTKDYDGTPLTKNSFTNDNYLASGHVITAITITGSQTDVGSCDNIPSGAVIKKGNTDVTSSYSISYEKGTLTVNRKAVTITAADGTKAYNGTALTESGFTHTALGTADTHAFTVAMTSGSTITNVGSASNVIATVDGVAVTTGTATEVGNYLVTTANGSLTVNPKAITITTGSDSKGYDGTALTKTKTSITGLENGETATITATGSQTEIGSSTNTYQIEWGTASSSNYTITESLGTLEVTKNNSEITLTAASDSKTYDGTALINSGVTAAGQPAGFTVVATASGSQTDAGSSANVVNDGYVIKNAGGEDKTANFTKVTKVNGTLEVTAKTVDSPTITLSETSYTYDGNAKTPTVTVKDGKTTIPAKEYSVDYSNNKNVGTATVTITDNKGGNYTVSGSTTFKIIFNSDINGDKVVNVADIVKAINEGQSQEEIEKIENIIMKK